MLFYMRLYKVHYILFTAVSARSSVQFFYLIKKNTKSLKEKFTYTPLNELAVITVTNTYARVRACVCV